MKTVSGSNITIDEKYLPYNKGSIKDKSAWTEKRLQELQAKLFEHFPICKSACNLCTERPCDSILNEMEKYLLPYGISIFKRSFKWRSTLEEFDRVVTESVNALLMDIWGKKKFIHRSFGSMLKWKMVFYLDGKINLFDTERFCSLDQLQGSFLNSGDVNGEDVIEYYSETFREAFENQDMFLDVNRKNSIKSIVDLLEASVDTYNKYIDVKQRYSIYIRSLFAFNRFLKHRDNFLMFKNKSKARFYYEKMLDILKKYLNKSGEVCYKSASAVEESI